MKSPLTEWEAVRNTVLFLWAAMVLTPLVVFDDGEAISLLFIVFFVLPTTTYGAVLYRRYKKTNFKSFDAYFYSALS